jgi:hypothetical protein
VLAAETPTRRARIGQPSWQRSARGGVPAHQRVLRTGGRQTARRLLAAGRPGFGDRGFHAAFQGPSGIPGPGNRL